MSTDPADIPAIPAMTVTSTALGFGSTMTTVRPAHRAVMTAETAAANLCAKAGLEPPREPGAHRKPTPPAGFGVEVAARLDAVIRDLRGLTS